jgi:leader peptidase (prepilin peptidase)/N-methyltransferase
MEVLLYIVSALFGLAIGSFLNVLIDRLPLKKSLVFPPSHCEACSRKLSFFDLIPVLSYLMLRGRCRYCRARIPLRVLLVEIGGGIVFILSYWRFGATAEFAYAAFWSCVFLVIMFIDWEHKLILNRITYPAVLIALVVFGVDTIFPEWGVLTSIKSFWPDSGILGISIVNSVIGGAIGFVFFLIVFLIYSGGMGMGDIKLAGLIGLVTGLPLVIAALITGILIGGLVAILLLVLGKKGRKDVIPYGTFLAIGPIVALFWGNEILNWYLGFF